LDVVGWEGKKGMEVENGGKKNSGGGGGRRN